MTYPLLFAHLGFQFGDGVLEGGLVVHQGPLCLDARGRLPLKGAFCRLASAVGVRQLVVVFADAHFYLLLKGLILQRGKGLEARFSLWRGGIPRALNVLLHRRGFFIIMKSQLCVIGHSSADPWKK